MDITETKLPGVKIITPKRIGDSRGWFCETFNQRLFGEAGITCAFVQDNQSFSAARGTLRGLHYQKPPFAQDKLIRVLKGAILDVAVDIRKNSPTYGQHVTARLSAAEGNQFFVPAGFAHGILTLEPDTELFYKVSNFYSAANDCGIRWNDPTLNVAWGVDEASVMLSDKDKTQPLFADCDNPFVYE